jgi:hypothetical protein
VKQESPRLQAGECQVPEPEDIGDRWHDWRLKNWGCKWDPEIYEFSKETTEIYLRFDSPWSPPINGIAWLSKQVPSCIFELDYSEPGSNLQGRVTVKNGKIIQHTTGNCYGKEKTCPNCGEMYAPEIDLDGEITEDRCEHCDAEFN